MKAIILVGGYGTRLRPLTLSVPKPLIHFCNKSIVEYQIQALAKAGVTKVILCVAYAPSSMTDAVKILEETYGISIVCSREMEPLGTGGPIRLAEDILINDNEENDDENFFVCNSDIICDFPFEKLKEMHKQKNADCTIVVTEVEDPTKYGVVVHDESNKVEKFVEKPKDFVGNFINAGLYIFKKSVIQKIPLRQTSLERETFPLIAQTGNLYCMHLVGYWADIGQPKDFLKGTKLYLETLRKKNENEKNKSSDLLAIGENIQGNVLIHETACIGDGCIIGPNVTIGPNCKVRSGCRISDCAIMADVEIQSYSYLNDSIVGWQSVVGQWVRIDGLTVVGENVKVKNELYINSAFILPHKVITESIQTPGAIIM